MNKDVQFATLETRRKLDRVNFSQRFLGLLLGTGKEIGQ